MNFKNFSLIVLSFQGTYLFAQDYPYEEYDDSPYGEIQRQGPAKIQDPDMPGALPRPGAQKKAGPPRVRPISVQRLSIKAGGHYTFASQNSSANSAEDLSYSGIGFGAAASLGWDIVSVPLYFEFELGFRRLLTTQDYYVNEFPFAFSIHYRVIMGRNLFFKPGIRGGLSYLMSGSSLDTVIEEETEKQFSPTMGVTALFDFNHFIVEPTFTLYYSTTEAKLYDASLRVGYRF